MTASDASAADARDVAVYRLPLGQESNGQAASGLPQDREWVEPIWQRNAVWFCQLRWIVVASLSTAGVAGFFPLLMNQLGLHLSPVWPLGAAGLLAVFNLGFIKLARTAGAGTAGISVHLLLWAQIVTDLLVLTAVIHCLGNGFQAAPFMYLFHIILACIAFSPLESLGVVALAAILYLACWSLESLGLLARESIALPSASSAVPSPVGASLAFQVLPMLIIWGVTWYLVSRLASTVRQRDHALFLTNRQLEASIDERSKHMLQTTHQLKAPFAAIHAQTQLLLGDYCGALPAAARQVAEKISDRCLVLARQVQEMLQLANLRSQGQSPMRRQQLNLANLVEDILNRVEPSAKHRDIHFQREIQPVIVNGIQDHLAMLIDNLVVNAVNYSFDHGVVSVACQSAGKSGTVFSVQDHGIGIPKHKLPRIFDDYYRTEEAVQHNRSSTGLGLAIVRQVACADQLPVLVESAPGWGTRFTVHFPSLSISPQPEQETESAAITPSPLPTHY